MLNSYDKFRKSSYPDYEAPLSHWADGLISVIDEDKLIEASGHPDPDPMRGLDPDDSVRRTRWQDDTDRGNDPDIMILHLMSL